MPARVTSYWEALRAKLAAKRIRVVALDLPTSWTMAAKAGAEFTGRIFEAINAMLLDMLAVEAVVEGYAARFAIFAIVARLQPVALWIVPQDAQEASMRPIAALRSVSSGRPLVPCLPASPSSSCSAPRAECSRVSKPPS
jgi:hypothetical protein